MPQKPQRKAAPSPSRAHNGIVQCKPLFAICLQKSTLPSVILNLIQNLSKAQAKTYTAPESTFVASACECGVAVQGDGLQLYHHMTIDGIVQCKPLFAICLNKKAPCIRHSELDSESVQSKNENLYRP